MLESTIKENSDLVKSKASQIVFSDNMKSLKGEVFTVRSSSPEEDLEDSSFAGLYDTLLGPKRDNQKKQ